MAKAQKKRAKKPGPNRKALTLDDQAAALVEANIAGDDATAEKYGITVRTLRRYRAELREGGDLSDAVRYRLEQMAEADDWAHEATETIREALAFIKRYCRDTEYLGPDALEAVTGALAILVDAKIAMQLIEASLNAQRPEDDRTAAAADSKNAAPIAGANGWSSQPVGSA